MSPNTRGRVAAAERAPAPPHAQAESALATPSASIPEASRSQAAALTQTRKDQYQDLQRTVGEYLSALGELIGSAVPASFKVLLVGRQATSPMRVAPARHEVHVFAGRKYEAETSLRCRDAIVPHEAGHVFSVSRAHSVEKVSQLVGDEIGLLSKKVAESADPARFAVVQDVSDALHALAQESYTDGVGFLIAKQLGLPGKLGISRRETFEGLIRAHIDFHASEKQDGLPSSQSPAFKFAEAARFLAASKALAEIAVSEAVPAAVREELAKLMVKQEARLHESAQVAGVNDPEQVKAALGILAKSLALGSSERIESYEKMRAAVNRRYDVSIPAELEILAENNRDACSAVREAAIKLDGLFREQANFRAEARRPLLGGLSLGENVRRAAWNLLESALRFSEPVPA